MSKPRIGFVGVGLMGHGIAKNLLAKGFPLALKLHRNRAAADDLLAAGATEAASHAELARNADLVILCVTGAPQVEEVVLGAEGIASAAQAGLIVVDTSTSEPATTTRMRNVLAEQNVRFVDAPLARTPVEAEQGRLNIMVGADDATFAELKPVLQAFCENWSKVSLAYAKSKNLTPYDVLTIASMVEKETLAPDERPLVAAVIYNRLHAHMPLGIDSTLRYGLNIPPTQSILESQLQSSSPYNTRLHTGLPPTAIANPGLASIEAAAHPAHVDYLYFVRKPDKVHHYFTASFQDFVNHEIAYGYK